MFYLYSMHGPVLMKMAYTFSCVTRLGMRKQLQVTKLLYYLMLVAEPKRKVRVLVLTFLHDRWYVSWLVLTVSGGACNVSSIQYTARIPGSIQPVYPQYVECGVSCLCAAPHPCTTSH